jgi:hypothetical protein
MVPMVSTGELYIGEPSVPAAISFERLTRVVHD